MAYNNLVDCRYPCGCLEYRLQHTIEPMCKRVIPVFRKGQPHEERKLSGFVKV
jgi:hypothetical protein